MEKEQLQFDIVGTDLIIKSQDGKLLATKHYESFDEIERGPSNLGGRIIQEGDPRHIVDLVNEINKLIKQKKEKQKDDVYIANAKRMPDDFDYVTSTKEFVFHGDTIKAFTTMTVSEWKDLLKTDFGMHWNKTGLNVLRLATEEEKPKIDAVDEDEETDDEESPQTEDKELLITQVEVLRALNKGWYNVVAEKITQYVLDNNNVHTIRDDNKPEIWIYEKQTGIYVPNGRTYIAEIVRKICGKKATKTILNSVLWRIEVDTYIEMDEFLREHNVNLICLKNGVYNIKTRSIEPHSPSRIFFSRINVNYDPDAKCPTIQKFFREIVSEEDAFILEELFGFMLFRKYFIAKIFVLSGIGANGKTQVIKLIKSFIGENNWTGLTPQQITENQFMRGDLFGKHVCLAADVSNTDMKNTGVLKALTGEDPISADRKFKTSLTFTNFAKLVFAMNQIPRIDDDSDGLMRRFVLIDFRERFYTKQEIALLPVEERTGIKIADRFVIDKLTTDDELSGLFNLSICHLEYLIDNGCFSYSKTTEQTRHEIMLKSNSIVAFINEFIVESPNMYITKSDLGRVYADFCKKANVNMTNEQHIHNVLLKKFEDVREHRIMVGDVRVRVWRGIKWASDETTSEFGGSLIMSVLGTSVHPVQQNQPFLTSSKLDRVTFEELEKGRTIGTGWTGCRDNDRKEFLSIVKGIGSVDFDMFAKLSIQHNICKTDIEADALIKQLVTNGDLMEVKPGEYHAT